MMMASTVATRRTVDASIGQVKTQRTRQRTAARAVDQTRCGRRELISTTAMTAAVGSCCCSGAAGARQPINDDMFATCMLHGMEDYERDMREYKSRLFAENVHGKSIVEVGIGVGVNLPFYYHSGGCGGRHVTGVDPNPSMRAHALETAQEIGRRQRSMGGLPESSFDVVPGFAERLPFEDGTVDCLITTLTLCSVGNVQGSIREINRCDVRHDVSRPSTESSFH